MLHLTAKNFETEVKQSTLPTIVMFYAVWCGKCAMMTPVLEELEEKYHGQFKFCEIEIEESAVLAAEYETDIVPTFILFKNGTVCGELKGMMSEFSFEQSIQKIFRNS